MSDAIMPRPTTDNRDEWKTYWTAQGEQWRTEPEISVERQRELAERRDTIKPDIPKGIYPFKDVRLSRADVEWLLHEHGPIDWRDEGQRGREGLDLRGALIQSDLAELPLAKARLSLSAEEWAISANEERKQGAAHLENAFLSKVHLEGADLNNVILEEVFLTRAHLEGASLRQAHLSRANLRETHLEGANLREAHLERADLSEAYLERADLREAHLQKAFLFQSHLENTDLSSASLQEADLSAGHLEGAYLSEAHLEGARARLQSYNQRVMQAMVSMAA